MFPLQLVVAVKIERNTRWDDSGFKEVTHQMMDFFCANYYNNIYL